MTLTLLPRWASRLRALVLGVIAVALLAGVAPPARAAATAASGQVRVDLAAADGGVLDVDAPFTVTIHASNLSEGSVSASRFTVSYSPTPLASREDVLAWVTQAQPAADGRELGAGPLAALSSWEESTEVFSVDPSTSDEPRIQALAALAPGVYPLWTTVTGASFSATAVSTLVVSAAEDASPVGVLVPITAPARTTGLIDATELAELTAPDGSLRAQLNAVSGTAAILAVDPAIVASIRVLGSDAPQTATAWLEDLRGLPNSRFALQYGDADLATQFAAGLSEPLQLGPLPVPAGITPTHAPEASDDPSPTPPEDVTPETGLLDIGAATAAVAWPATGTAGSTAVAALSAAGTDITLVPSTMTNEASGARATTGDAQLLVYDEAISAVLQQASLAAEETERHQSLATATALAALTGDGPMLVTIDRAADRTEDALRDTIASALTLAGRTPADLDALIARAPDDVTLRDVDPDATRVSALTAFLTEETEVAQFATVLADPALLTSRHRAAILQVMGNGWASDAEFERAAAELREGTQDTLESVAIVPPSGITLAASSAALGFSVRNELPWPVVVNLTAQPNDLRLVVQTTTEVQAAARQNTRAEVPVQARVGNGESSVVLKLRSPTGVAVGDAVTVDVSVRAEWESVGLAIMVTIVAALIVFGIVRTVRRRRGEPETGGE